ncbi:DUF4249 domain-containing protein [Hymenobacter sp. RP-2-7]|uniref:DUF4249 domain-containing protein n=1 Tax=Hymenobacter polaris TaxID=2682546 RepID=A0A7Y0ADG6_9BACT|nr:DUF4249 domain-containing protein [Hymenobacter polaris]NML65302.1 DUF4249 domain-containing protein [Hymenobacter polaris]
MTRLYLYALRLSGLLALGGCVDRYTPDVAPTDRSSLVVDGFINAQGSSVIKLSRSFSVNTKSTPVEAKAQVFIQDDAGRRYGLAENPAGTYTSATNALDPSRQYQLRITTSLGREYASDLAPVVSTPPIDTLTWQLTTVGGIQLYLTTHGAGLAARYYRWDYEETYQFTAAFQSALEYMASTNTVVSRPPERQIYTCWRTEASTQILQGNTVQLSQNTLTDFPLLNVPPDMRLHLGYSVLVRQVAEDQTEYDYWERLRKNTEALGTVNDPLPGRVTGNVHALADASEAVLGYVGVHTVTEKRLFIDGAQFPTPRPSSVLYNAFYASCEPAQSVGDTDPFYLQQFRAGFLIPIKRNDMTPSLITVSTPACVDCRLRGTNVKPSYWP